MEEVKDVEDKERERYLCAITLVRNIYSVETARKNISHFPLGSLAG